MHTFPAGLCGLQFSSGPAGNANPAKLCSTLGFTKGEANVQAFDLPEAKYWGQAFCKTCGCQMPKLSRTGKAWVVPAGTLDGDPGVRPTRNLYFGSRASWFVATSELETHEEFPRKS